MWKMASVFEKRYKCVGNDLNIFNDAYICG